MKRTVRAFSVLGSLALALTACGGGGGNPPITSFSPTPFPSATPTPPVTQSLACPSSGSAPSDALSAGSGSLSEARRAPARAQISSDVPGALAVTYAASRRTASIDDAISAMHAGRTADLQFDALGLGMRVVSVQAGRENEAIAKLRSVPGVESVSRIAYRQRLSVTANDPYYAGFGPGAPYFEAAGTPGQWDMHVMHVQTAWNDVASSAPVTGAKIAIVDTGVDVTHPELTGGKIVRTRCFVTYPSSGTQSTSTFVTDTDGHGTDVAGIADADTDNGLGFASVAFGAPLLAYRIFPTDPSGGCENSKSAQCETNTLDESTAINDAVTNGAKVINLSLGSTGPCSTNDPEYKAVENAIAHNVVVVAAAGNESTASLDCPAADPGVIAVGATGLQDSVPSAIVEAVASYSNYLSGTGGGYYMVAPGGDPASNDPDDLHWIENIYSSTAAQQGTCTADNKSSSTTADCRVLIAGTSQATPHVAGVASLILAVRPSYTPAEVAAALCASATDIGDSKQGCGRVDAAAAVEYAKTH